MNCGSNGTQLGILLLFIILLVIIVAGVGGGYGWGRVHRQVQLAQRVRSTVTSPPAPSRDTSGPGGSFPTSESGAAPPHHGRHLPCF
jgi:hypothetical protein